MRRELVLLVAAGGLSLGTSLLRSGEPQPDGARPVDWVKSTGNDTYQRTLAIRTNRFGGAYAADQPIAVSVEIRNCGPAEAGGAHPSAQLHPYLDAWIEVGGKRSYHFIRLDIENRLQIKKGEKFARLLDLSRVLPLGEPGEYRISLGHDNGIVTDIGDWTGHLRSPEYLVRIVPVAADAP